MTMCGGVQSKTASEINVTPLIDVLLVLLVIFMVIVPIVPKGLNAVAPRPANSAEATVNSTIVVSVLAAGDAEPRYAINQTPLLRGELEPRLAAIFQSRQQRAMFVQADAGLAFSRVAEVIDMGHQANVDTIGLLPPTAR